MSSGETTNASSKDSISSSPPAPAGQGGYVMYVNPNYPPPDYPQYPPAAPAPQLQQQQQVVVVTAGLATEPVRVESFSGQIALACFVFWCCDCLFGLVAYILAEVAKSQAASDPDGARKLGKASYGVSIAGIIVTIAVVAIVCGVIFGSASSASSSINLSGGSSSGSSNSCGSGYKYYINGRCYRYKTQVASISACGSLSYSTYYYSRPYCYYN